MRKRQKRHALKRDFTRSVSHEYTVFALANSNVRLGGLKIQRQEMPQNSMRFFYYYIPFMGKLSGILSSMPLSFGAVRQPTQSCPPNLAVGGQVIKNLPKERCNMPNSVSLSNLKFQENALRIIVVDGEPWFLAADVCRIIGIKNPTNAVKILDDDELALKSFKGLSNGNDQANFISESGMYKIVMRSQDAIRPGTMAHSFTKWVTGEVLPAIRKNGYYSINITRAQAGELSALIADRFEGGQRPYAWSRFNNHFRLASSRDLPANRFDEAVAYIKTIPVPQARAIRYETKSRYFPTAMQSHALVELSKYIDKLDGFDRKHSKDFLDHLDRTMTSEWTDVDAAIIGAFSQLLRLRVLKKQLKVI